MRALTCPVELAKGVTSCPSWACLSALSADAVPGLEFLDEEDRAYAVEALQALAEGREPPPPPDDEVRWAE